MITNLTLRERETVALNLTKKERMIYMVWRDGKGSVIIQNLFNSRQKGVGGPSILHDSGYFQTCIQRIYVEE